jgi:hypothetical protein
MLKFLNTYIKYLTLNIKLILKIFILFFIFFILTQISYSEENSARINRDPICLKIDKCWEDGVNCSRNVGHRVRLTLSSNNNLTTQIPPNARFYIAECINFIDGETSRTLCTTKSEELDKNLFGENSNNLRELIEKVKYKNEGINEISGAEIGIFEVDSNNQAIKINPKIFTTNENGQMTPIEWQTFSEIPVNRTWAAFFIDDISQTNTQSNNQGLQQSRPVTQPEINCETVFFDPAGRIFDAKTLEPIPEVKVMLLKKYNDQYADAKKSEKTIINPFITGEDGAFTFFVSNGEYQLQPSHINYEFPLFNLQEIHQNYQNIYINPRFGQPRETKTLIYPAQTGEIIKVNNRIEFRDIPLKPKNNTGYFYPLKIYSFNQQLDKIKREIIFNGKSSHPFTKATLYLKTFEVNGEQKIEIYKTYLSDNFGKFNFSFPLSNLNYNQIIIEVKFEKTDLTKSKTDFKNNTINIKIDQIIPSLEGFAYDNDGKTLPNTKIGVYFSFSNIPYFETNTDNRGYFRIPTNKIPNQVFEIRYKTPKGEQIKLTTTQFIQQNLQHYIKNKININQFIDEKGNIIDPVKTTNVKSKDVFDKDNKNNQNQKTKFLDQSNFLTNKTNQILLTIIILIILIITASLFIFSYYIKNKSQHQN